MAHHEYRNGKKYIQIFNIAQKQNNSTLDWNSLD